MFNKTGFHFDIFEKYLLSEPRFNSIYRNSYGLANRANEKLHDWGREWFKLESVKVFVDKRTYNWNIKIRLNEAILKLIRDMVSSVAFQIIIMVRLISKILFRDSSSLEFLARIRTLLRLARIRGQVEGT